MRDTEREREGGGGIKREKGRERAESARDRARRGENVKGTEEREREGE